MARIADEDGRPIGVGATLGVLLLLLSGVAEAADPRRATPETPRAAESLASSGDSTVGSQAMTSIVLPADGIWYLGLGGATTWADRFRFGTSIGFGRRSMYGDFALDWSLFNPNNYYWSAPNGDGGTFRGYVLSIARLGLHYYTSADADSSAYFGGALGFSLVKLPREGRNVDDWERAGATGDAVAGYEFFRLHACRVYVEARLSLPIFRTRSETSGSAFLNSEREKGYTLQSSLSLGLGWGSPRETWGLREEPPPPNVATSARERPSPVEVRRAPVVRYAIYAREPSRRFVVRDSEGDVVGACVERCTLALKPGEYDLAPLNEDGTEDSSTEFEVVGSGRMDFEDPNRSAATAGLIMGLAGPALILLGGALFASQVERDEPDPLLGYAIVGSTLAGLVATPMGWIIYASNQSPVIQEASAALHNKGGGMGRSRMTLGIRGAF